VSPTATDDDLKAAYKKACYASHPDRSQDLEAKKALTEKFRMVQQAWQIFKKHRDSL
jgi:DnaJ-class molecular chaperone